MSGTRHTAGESTAAPEFVPQFSWVVLVASLGGMEAFSTVLSRLPSWFPVPVLVVQHRPQIAQPDPLAAVLSRRTHLPVRVAVDGVTAHQPGVTVVPGATAAAIDPSGLWRLRPTSKATGPGDVLLASAAYAGRTIAVILTDYQADGSRGCRSVKVGGGRVLVQDPSDARASGMPASAISTGCVDFVLPLQRIPAALLALTVAPGAAELFSVPIPPWARLTS
ncbi:chemotaxis protein CheB [Mycobacterium kubicae]|uniref:protein-glutamate methylesterase n=1 Tax=Mycobacterium kubicae TaxID=120959 RepID=A0AAX1JD22_9MYCO|nr:chemotaxis protein CheB [Mycobacterium kubicae]MCV7098365.1 chemotaxis protein CheB [Mycobacterium kubicae]ORW02194.1 chemotaxis protein CheB [Mycobacterium kubicae]QNI11209.1 chemotaxis protein CheB [Mycobacterium kubicae]QPI39423.1 chemotaxis protein CheB [Mycobacterium kubicae]GFG64010.1 chemotaxis protein CheB [Mycobacterium kubicae]